MREHADALTSVGTVKAAALLGCSRQKVAQLCDRGVLEHFRLGPGGDRRIRLAVLYRFMKAEGEASCPSR